MIRPLRLLVWQVHGGWMDAFVRGRHTYLLPVDRDGGRRALSTAGATGRNHRARRC